MAHSALIEILVLIGAATTVATLFHFMRIPTIVGFIAAGCLVGPYGLGWVGSLPGAKILSEVATVLLMFTIGLEVSVKKLSAMRRSFLGLGGLQVLSSVFVIGLALRFAFDQSWPKWIFFGCLAALSSTAIIIKLFERDRSLNTPYGNASMGALVFQDVAVIPMMILLSVWQAPTEAGLPKISFDQAWMLVVRLGLAALSLWIGAKFVAPTVLKYVLKTKSRELFFFAIALLCLGMGLLINGLGLSLSLGAFAAGVMISDSPYGRQVVADVHPLRDNILGIFFVSIGMLLDGAFIVEHFLALLLILLIVFGLKISLTYGAGRVLRYSHRTSLIVALTMFQVGEFSLVLAGQGFDQKIINAIDYQYILSVAILSMAFTPFVFDYAQKLAFSERWSSLRLFAKEQTLTAQVRGSASQISHMRKTREKEGRENHTIIVGYGYAGRAVASALDALQLPYVVIEMNVDLTKKSQKDPRFIMGDASSEAILEHAGIEHARMVVLAVSGSRIASGVLAGVRSLRTDIPIVIRAEYVRDLDGFKNIEGLQVVVSELESTLELIARILRNYGVPTNEIEGFTSDIHKQLHVENESIGASVKRHVEAPELDTITGVRPVVLAKGKGINKTPAELRLRELTGATMVAVHRAGSGTLVPGPSFILQADDVVYLIGKSEEVDAAQALMLDETPESGSGINIES